MIVTLLLMALMQEGPVQTARPESTVDFSAYAEVVRARQAQAGAPAVPVLTRIEDCRDPAKRLSGETEFECTSRFRTQAWVRSVQPEGEPVDHAAPVYPPVRTAEDCAIAANRGPNEAEFDCALRLSYELQGDERVGRPGFRTGRAEGEVPAWALTDPAAWEASECGSGGDDACRRQARNRLAMARAGIAAEAPADEGGAPASDNCRMVMRRSENGFGGSLSRVCGDEAASAAALDRLRAPLQPAVEPCDRPASLETQEAWIARCRALPVR